MDDIRHFVSDSETSEASPQLPRSETLELLRDGFILGFLLALFVLLLGLAARTGFG